MGKTILIITGSPRKKGNSNLLADAFAKGAQAAGHSILRFDSAVDKVDGCTACDSCWSTGKACTFDDGFDRLSPMLEQADLVVFCSPVYWYTFSAQIKAAIDKLYAYMVPQCERKLHVSETALIMCAEEGDPKVFNGAAMSYKEMIKLLQWKDKGMLLIPGVGAKGAVAAGDALARAEAMGSGI